MPFDFVCGKSYKFQFERDSNAITKILDSFREHLEDKDLVVENIDKIADLGRAHSPFLVLSIESGGVVIHPNVSSEHFSNFGLTSNPTSREIIVDVNYMPLKTWHIPKTLQELIIERRILDHLNVSHMDIYDGVLIYKHICGNGVSVNLYKDGECPDFIFKV